MPRGIPYKNEEERIAGKEKYRLYKKDYGQKYYTNNTQMFLDAQLKYSYGITRAERDAMKKAQNGRCKLCNKPCADDKQSTRLCVDHVEIDGKKIIRGLLCHTCNKALGMLGDNEEGLARALAYVRGPHI